MEELDTVKMISEAFRRGLDQTGDSKSLVCGKGYKKPIEHFLQEGYRKRLFNEQQIKERKKTPTG